jgi:ribosomal protein S12 methylthiotransferase accessory factor
MPELKSRLKAPGSNLDKVLPPEETVARVRELLGASGHDILAESLRIDTGRLGIPVFMSMASAKAAAVLPGRKQMGKGPSVIQAEASALMELVERWSFFTYFGNGANFRPAYRSDLVAENAGAVMSAAETALACGEVMDEETAAKVLDLVELQFCPAFHVHEGRDVLIPGDLFKMLNEYNGSCAGNVYEESVLQGGCELVERHVCAVIDRTKPELPHIDPASFDDPVLVELYEKFRNAGIELIIKDFSLNMPVPTVGVLAWDPASFPEKSEIVYTAGTSSSPAKAAIRALTEIAQLAGDFETGACYEPSGLPKYLGLDEFDWLRAGPVVALKDLPSICTNDIGEELKALAAGLQAQGTPLYAVDTIDPKLGVQANYCLVPGFEFRERPKTGGLGMFIGRMLAEHAPLPRAEAGLDTLEGLFPKAFYLPFQRGMLSLRSGEVDTALRYFEASEHLQPDDDNRAMAAFYQAYALTLQDGWDEALPRLHKAVELCPEVKEYFNLRGVALYKKGEYEAAALDFEAALNLDAGSAMDLANLGLCNIGLGKTREALHCLAKALELDPSLDFARKKIEELLPEEKRRIS